MSDPEGCRTCCRCGITWPIGDFYVIHRDRRTPSRDRVCKHCRSEIRRKAYAAAKADGRVRKYARNDWHEPRQDAHEPEGRWRRLVEMGEMRTRRYLARMKKEAANDQQ